MSFSFRESLPPVSPEHRMLACFKIPIRRRGPSRKQRKDLDMHLTQGTNNNNQGKRAPLPRNTACIPCKKRKIKCDGQRPSCSPCIRQAQDRGLDPSTVSCVFPGPSKSSEEAQKLVGEHRKELDRLRSIEQLESRLETFESKLSNFLDSQAMFLPQHIPQTTSQSTPSPFGQSSSLSPTNLRALDDASLQTSDDNDVLEDEIDRIRRDFPSIALALPHLSSTSASPSGPSVSRPPSHWPFI
ncbi:hypothetical protein BT69DRAFT_1353805 [Atractiella rhizophila]|nr:hypothetical protein BT69DRAFT_1353805 [Atractiella rhizophila]